MTSLPHSPCAHELHMWVRLGTRLRRRLDLWLRLVLGMDGLGVLRLADPRRLAALRIRLRPRPLPRPRPRPRPRYCPRCGASGSPCYCPCPRCFPGPRCCSRPRHGTTVSPRAGICLKSPHWFLGLVPGVVLLACVVWNLI